MAVMNYDSKFLGFSLIDLSPMFYLYSIVLSYLRLIISNDLSTMLFAYHSEGIELFFPKYLTFLKIQCVKKFNGILFFYFDLFIFFLSFFLY